MTILPELKYTNRKLTLEATDLTSLPQIYGTPLYVYSEAAFLRPIRELQKGLAGLDHLICFAVKSNPNLSVLKLIRESGLGADLVSAGEMKRAELAGFSPNQMVFSGVGKTKTEIRNALNAGIFSFHVESGPELKLISKIAEASNQTAYVAFRFNPDVNAKTHPYISTGLKKNKFGLERAEIISLTHEIATGKLPAIKLHGISVHIGSQLLKLSPLGAAFQKLGALIIDVEKILGHPLRFADVGGGVGIRYKNETPPSITSYTKLIQMHFGKKSKFKGRLRILMEPGRLISGSAGLLLTELLYRKTRGKKDFLIVDAAMNDLLRPALYESHHEVLPLTLTKGGRKTKSDIVGPVCETSDFLALDRALPATLAAGEHLAFLCAGAYGMSMSGNYNSRNRPAEVLISGGTHRLVRARETIEKQVELELPFMDSKAKGQREIKP